jgi:hypothetical protein
MHGISLASFSNCIIWKKPEQPPTVPKHSYGMMTPAISRKNKGFTGSSPFRHQTVTIHGYAVATDRKKIFIKKEDRNMLKKTVFTAIAALALFAFGTAAFASTQVVVNGSTTVLPVVQAAAEAFMKGRPDVSISISGGGSGNGIKAIIDGTTDIAMSSRFLKDKEITTAMEKGVYPVPFRVAVDAIVPVVHPGNPVNNLTVEQLSLIYQERSRTGRRWAVRT